MKNEEGDGTQMTLIKQIYADSLLSTCKICGHLSCLRRLCAISPHL